MLTKQDVEELKAIHRQLVSERGSWDALWQDIVGFMGSAYNDWNLKGVQKPELKDTTAVEASNTLADGVSGYAFNRQMAWFDYGLESIDEKKVTRLTKNGILKILQTIKPVSYKLLARSRFYVESRAFIRSCVDLGTAVMYFDFDKKKTKPRFKNLRLKDVCLLTDEEGVVDGIFREVSLTRREAENFFGEDKLPQAIKDAKDTPLKKYTFIHLISEATRWEFDVEGKGDWISVYLYKDAELPLLEEKLSYKPFAVWRYNSSSNTPWGVDAPGIICLPLMKSLDLLNDDFLTLAELVSKGHWKKTKGLEVDFRAGSVTELDKGEDFVQMNQQGDLSWLYNQMEYFRNTINRNYDTDIFLILSRNVDRQKTATEVAGIETEKSALMSAFFAQFGDEFLEPLLEWLFKMTITYALPEDIDPAELEQIVDLDIKIDFVSPMFIEQKRNIELTPTLKWIQDVVSLAQINPQILDLINFDKVARIDHETRGANADCIFNDTQVGKVRNARLQAQEQAMQNADNQQKFQNGMEAVKTLGGLQK